MTFNREISKLGQYIGFSTTPSSEEVIVSFGKTESSTSLFIEKELLDHLGYAGTVGDVLTSTGTGVSWSSIGAATQGIQGIQGTTGIGVQGIQGTTGSVGVQGIQGPAGVGTGGGSSISRTIVSQSTGSIGIGSTSNITITGYKSYALLKSEVSDPAWVTLYCDTSSRTADSSRLITEDPAAGSGVIAEVITTSASETLLFTPTTIGFNNDGTPSSNIYAKVVNRAGFTTSITVSLTIVQLES